jgi:ketosteroid isomerase-like protein
VSDEATLRELFASWEAGDFSTGPALFAEDVRFSGAQPEGQVEAMGVTGVTSFMKNFLAEWELYRVEVHGIENLGEGRFLGTGTQHGKGKGSRVDITAPVHIAVQMESGKITVLHFFLTREEALSALGAAGP